MYKLILRLYIYGKPFEVRNYAKFIFNANELPKDTEQTTAFFERFIIIPFTVYIPENERDTELHCKIINNELAGVFLWVLDGLKRLLANKKFTECRAAAEVLKQYQTESNNVAMFISDNNYQPSINNSIELQSLRKGYEFYCRENGYRPCGTNEFSKRLERLGFEKVKNRGARIVYIEKQEETAGTDDET